MYLLKMETKEEFVVTVHTISKGVSNLFLISKRARVCVCRGNTVLKVTCEQNMTAILLQLLQ